MYLFADLLVDTQIRDHRLCTMTFQSAEYAIRRAVQMRVRACSAGRAVGVAVVVGAVVRALLLVYVPRVAAPKSKVGNSVRKIRGLVNQEQRIKLGTLFLN